MRPVHFLRHTAESPSIRVSHEEEWKEGIAVTYTPVIYTGPDY
jgi:hypothetical protein